MPKIIFIKPNGIEHEVEAPLGKSLLDIAQVNNIEIEGACEGSLACSTCHVIVKDNWFDCLKPIKEEESDMLDLAYPFRPRRHFRHFKHFLTC